MQRYRRYHADISRIAEETDTPLTIAYTAFIYAFQEYTTNARVRDYAAILASRRARELLID